MDNTTHQVERKAMAQGVYDDFILTDVCGFRIAADTTISDTAPRKLLAASRANFEKHFESINLSLAEQLANTPPKKRCKSRLKGDLDSHSSDAGDCTRSPSPLVINETDKRKIGEKAQREEILEILHRIDATMKLLKEGSAD